MMALHRSGGTSIQDFTSGDVIDLSAIDAITGGANDAFSFIGSVAFSNTAGELRFENISHGGPIWIVRGDIDGNGVSDLEIVLVITRRKSDHRRKLRAMTPPRP